MRPAPHSPSSPGLKASASSTALAPASLPARSVSGCYPLVHPARGKNTNASTIPGVSPCPMTSPPTLHASPTLILLPHPSWSNAFHGVQSALVDAATTTIAGHLKTLLEQRGIETVMVGRTWGTVGVDKQFDVAFDCVGGEMGRRVARAVKPDGVVVHYGLLSGEPLGETGRRVEMFRLRDVVHACPRSELPELFSDVFSQLRAGRLRSRVASEVHLRDVPAALREYQPREGKLLIMVE